MVRLEGLNLGERGSKDVDGIRRTRERDLWHALVNTAMNHGFQKRHRTSWLTECLLAPQEGLCSMELGGLLVTLRKGLEGGVCVVWNSPENVQKPNTTDMRTAKPAEIQSRDLPTMSLKFHHQTDLFRE
jgi:hypothetical protein